MPTDAAMNQNGNGAAAAEEPPLRNINNSVDPDADPEDDEPAPYDGHILMQRNDPDLDELTIGVSPGQFIPHGDDWARTGECISRNAHLKYLFIGDFYNHDTEWMAAEEHQFKALCEGLARNKSIIQLNMYNNPFGGMEFTALIPFFKNNKLKHLLLSDDTEFDGPSTCLIANALATFSSLDTFHFQYWKPGSDAAEALFKSLSQHTQMKQLRLYGGELLSGKKAQEALISYMKSCSLTEFVFNDDLDDEGAIHMGIALGFNKSIKKLELTNTRGVKSKGWLALSMGLGSSNLEDVSLVNNTLKCDGLEALSMNWTHNSTIKRLCLTSSLSRVDGDGWLSFCRYLISPNCSVNCLSLDRNHLNDSHFNLSSNAFPEALAENKSIEHLSLLENGNITVVGWEAFSAVLRRNTVLQSLSLPYLNDEEALVIAGFLPSNKSIEKLWIGGYYYGSDDQKKMTNVGWGALADALCDRGCITRTFLSNHNIESISFDEDELPDSLVESFNASLMFNRLAHCHAARLKILVQHFSEYCQLHHRLQPFLSMPLEVLPRAMGWIAKQFGGLYLKKYDLIAKNLMYLLVKSVPDLFDLTGRAQSERKRKRSSKQRTLESYFYPRAG